MTALAYLLALSLSGLPGYSRQATLRVVGPVSAGTLVQVQGVETRALAANGEIRPDRNDFRVTYQGVEIDRVMLTTGSFVFRCQQAIATGVTSNDYVVEYGNPSETTTPKENWRNVYPAYVDGTDLASLTKTGTVTAVSTPRHRLLKLGVNPTLVRTPGYGDSINIREVELWWESPYFYAFYDADDNAAVDGISGWTSYLARSRDLITWERLGQQLTPGAPGGGDAASASDLVPHKFGSTYYATYLGTDVVTNGIPTPPYDLFGATAPSILGPWTKAGKLLTRSANGVDSQYDVDAVISTYDGGASYEMVYGASGTSGSYVGAGVVWATAPAPMGPWTKQTSILPNSEWVENPRVLRDSPAALWYLIANHIAPTTSPVHTDSDILYWSTDRHSFNPVNQTNLIESDEGAWDAAVIGVVSLPVIKDGMIYMGYDGGNAAALNAPNTFGHKYRDVGFVEGKFPFAQGSSIRLASGASAASAAILTGDGTVKVRANLALNGAVGVKAGGHSYALRAAAAWDADIGAYLPTPANLEVDGVPAATSYGESIGRTHLYEFRRVGSTLSVVAAGSVIATTSVDAGALSFYAEQSIDAEPTTVEEVWAVPPSSTALLPDTTPPTITSFSLPPTSTSTTVLLTFTATDDTSVTGYLVSESGTAPGATDPRWSATAPTSFTFPSTGAHTLYGWAKDAAGNVSARASATVTIAPVCTSWTYSAWSTCQGGTNTRAVLTSSPAGCTGGSPVTTQTCPTCDTFWYSAWSACQSGDTQVRTVTNTSPAGCTGGSPVTTEFCPYGTATLGNQVIGSTYGSFFGGGDRKGVNIVTLNADAQFTRYGFYSDTAYPAAKVKAVIYSTTAGAPDALLATSDEIVGVVVGWNAVSFAAPVELAAGTYGVGHIQDTNIGTITVPGSGFWNADTYSDGPTDPFGTASAVTAQGPAYLAGSFVVPATGAPGLPIRPSANAAIYFPIRRSSDQAELPIQLSSAPPPVTPSPVGWAGSTSLTDFPKTGPVTSCYGSETGCIVDIDDGAGGKTVAQRFADALALLSTKTRVLVRDSSNAPIVLTGQLTRGSTWSTLLDAAGRKEVFAYGAQRISVDASAITDPGLDVLRWNSGKEHWKGFEFTGAGNTGSYVLHVVGASNVLIEDFWIHDNSPASANGPAPVGVVMAAADITVQDVIAWNNTLFNTTEGGDGFATGGVVGSIPDRVHFVRDFVSRAGDDGFDFWGGDHVEAIDCVAIYSGKKPDGTANGGEGNGFKLGGMESATARTNSVVGAIALGSNRDGVNWNGQTGTLTAVHVTAAGNGAGAVTDLGRGIDLGTVSAGVLTDNISWANYEVDVGIGTVLRNTWQLGDADPLFADTASGDFRLQPASPYLTSAAGGVPLGASTVALQLLRDNWSRR